MCHAVVCRTCGKATWEGCGLHVEQALAGIPQTQRCDGHHRSEGTEDLGVRRVRRP